MAGKIKGITITLGADVQPLNKALEDVNKKTRDVQSELRQVERLLKLDPKNTDLLAQRQKLLAEAVENSREKLDRLKTAQEQVNEQFRKGEINEEQYRAFQREVVKAEQELEKFEKQLRETGLTAEQVGKKLQDAGQKMTDIGKDLSMKVTAPIVGLGTVAAKAAIDFESAFAGVRKTVDATEEEFSQLEKGIREMSQRMPASATDIAAVAEAAGQLGIETDNILKFTETMIGLGEATNLTAEEGATQFARFANIVGMSQQDFDRLGSSVVALGNSLATTEAEIVAMGMRLAGQGAQIGMTEAQIMALSAAMSSVGIEAEAGGTAMSTTLKKMQTAVSLGGKDLEKFAQVARMSAAEFARAFQADPAAALQSFIDGLAESSAAGENLTLILGELGISGIRESDTLLRLAGANDVLRGALETSTTAWEENSALQNEVAQRYATTESQLAMFKNSILDLGITLGEIIIPALISLVDAIRPVVDWLANLSPAAQRTIVVIAGLAAAIGPLLIVLGAMASGISAIIGIMPALGTALTALTGPIGIAVAAIAGLVAIGVSLYKNWDEIKAKASQIWTKIQEFFSKTLGSIKQNFEKIWNGIKDFFKKWGDEILLITAGPAGWVVLLGRKIAENWDGIKRKAEDTWNGLKLSLSSIWSNLHSTASSVWNNIKTAITSPIESAKQTVLGIIDTIKNAFAKLRIEIPKPKLPHVSVSWRSVGIGDARISIPDFDINWYKIGGIFKQPAVIGVGEAGAEAVIPLDKLPGMISDALREALGGRGVLASAGVVVQNMYVRNDQDIKFIARELFNLQQRAARAKGVLA